MAGSSGCRRGFPRRGTLSFFARLSLEIRPTRATTRTLACARDVTFDHQTWILARRELERHTLRRSDVFLDAFSEHLEAGGGRAGWGWGGGDQESCYVLTLCRNPAHDLDFLLAPFLSHSRASSVVSKSLEQYNAKNLDLEILPQSPVCRRDDTERCLRKLFLAFSISGQLHVCSAGCRSASPPRLI